jgi:hypothetical protein
MIFVSAIFARATLTAKMALTAKMSELHLLPKWGPKRVHKKSRTQFWMSDSFGNSELKVAPYSFRSVSLKFCPRARLVVLHATRVVTLHVWRVFLNCDSNEYIYCAKNIVIYTRGPSWDCRLVARGN